MAIIGKTWVDIKDPSGQRRLDRNDDYLRQEIRTALEREIPVIPLLVDRAKMPSSQDLPSDLEKLAYCQAINIRANRDFEPDMDLLMRTLEDELRIPAEGHAKKKSRPARPSAPKPEQATPPPQKLQTTPPDDRLDESVVERLSVIGDIDLALSDTSLSIDSASSRGAGTYAPAIGLPGRSRKAIYERCVDAANSHRPRRYRSIGRAGSQPKP